VNELHDYDPSGSECRHGRTRKLGISYLFLPPLSRESDPFFILYLSGKSLTSDLAGS
jgi:hypothetical protein